LTYNPPYLSRNELRPKFLDGVLLKKSDTPELILEPKPLTEPAACAAFSKLPNVSFLGAVVLILAALALISCNWSPYDLLASDIC